IIGRGMHPGIHADRVAGARFHAEPAEDATKLVDDEPLGVFLVSLALCIPLVVSRFDVNALRWARGGATKARNTAGRAIFKLGKLMNSPESFRIRTPLLGVRDGVDPIADR